MSDTATVAALTPMDEKNLEPIGDYTLKTRPWMRKTTPWKQLLDHEYKGSGTEADPYVVTWLPKDVENPINYGFWYKWSVTILAATGTLAVSMGSSMLSAALNSIKHHFPGHNSMMYTMGE
jgi:hypothetical protein